MLINVANAVAILQSGNVVAIPTETVYGLAARFDDVAAIEKIFLLKQRPRDNPLIVHVAEFHDVLKLADKVPVSLNLIKDFWPGSLTVVVPASVEKIPLAVRAGLATVAIRIPDHPVTRELIRNVGPLVAPSANLSGRPSATCAEHVENDFGKNFPVLDGGPCRGGVESTVIMLFESGWSLLRKGAITEGALADKLGAPIPPPKTEKPLSPGQKYRHYAPTAKLVPQQFPLLATKDFDAVLGFDDSRSPDLPLVSLGRRGDMAQNLNRLYAALRELDEKKFRKVAVDLDFNRTELGVTLYDRLEKACRGSDRG